MTERDRYERQVGREWVDALNLARAQAPVDEVADEAIQCLTKAQNKAGWIPCLEDIFDTVESPVSANMQLAVLDRLADAHRRDKHTVVATDEAKRMCLEQALTPGRQELPPPREEICRRILNALMETCCFATARVAMMAEGLFRSPCEADEWRAELRTACDDRLDSLIRPLSKDPSLARLPVPKRSRNRRPTAELIREPLVVLDDQSLREGRHHES